MPRYEEKFEQHRIDLLRRRLKKDAEKGTPTDYEIQVDDFKVVSRTNDIAEFDDYEQEVNANSRNLSILIFDGPGTNRNSRYSFLLHGEPGSNTRPLTGLGEIDQLIEERMANKDREHEMLRLQEKLKSNEDQLAEAEEYTGQLEGKIRDMENGQLQRQVGIGEFAGFVLSGLLKQNPQLLRGLPGGEALAGLLGNTAGTDPVLSPETAASFEKQPVVDEQTRNRISLIQQMQQTFNEQQMIGVFSIIEHLTATPDQIPFILNFINPLNKAA